MWKTLVQSRFTPGLPKRMGCIYHRIIGVEKSGAVPWGRRRARPGGCAPQTQAGPRGRGGRPQTIGDFSAPFSIISALDLSRQTQRDDPGGFDAGDGGLATADVVELSR